MTEKRLNAKRIVIKLGTQLMIREDGSLARKRLANLVYQCASLVHQGKELLIVSSGAVGLGRQVLNLKTSKLTLTEKQACAAVGQNLLMDVYQELFRNYELPTAQLLLTAYDFADRTRYLNLRETLEKLLELQVIPIINENDTVSTTELEDKGKSFGDNDKLSALVASKLGADLLVIFTNVDGIYTDNPQTNPNAQRIPIIQGFEQLKEIVTDGKSDYGRGGMASKIEAVKIAAITGVQTIITSGLKDNALSDIFNPDKERPGTLILAQNALPNRKRWFGLASGYQGVIRINDGAKTALIERFASLLPSGVVAVEGDFQPRQVVSIQDEQGIEIGRGVINFSVEDTRKIQGRQSREIVEILGPVENDVVIHRDNLVIYQEYQL